MKSLKLFGVALMALFTVGITMATSAFALPEINVTLTSAFPIHLGVTNLTIKTKLSEGSGTALSGEGILLLYLATELTSLGKFEASFEKIEAPISGSCNTTGDKAGEILTKGTWHLVYTSLSPLTLGILHLVQPFSFKCGSLEFTIKGSIIAGVSNPFLGQLESLGGILDGNGSGKPNIRGYYLDNGQTAKAKLEVGTAESAEEVGAVATHASGGKMAEIEFA